MINFKGGEKDAEIVSHYFWEIRNVLKCIISFSLPSKKMKFESCVWKELKNRIFNYISFCSTAVQMSLMQCPPPPLPQWGNNKVMEWKKTEARNNLLPITRWEHCPIFQFRCGICRELHLDQNFHVIGNKHCNFEILVMLNSLAILKIC